MLDTPTLYITLILSFMLTFAKDKIMTAAWIHRNICKHTTKKKSYTWRFWLQQPTDVKIIAHDFKSEVRIFRTRVLLPFLNKWVNVGEDWKCVVIAMILKRWANEMTIENGNNRIVSAVTKKINEVYLYPMRLMHTDIWNHC